MASNLLVMASQPKSDGLHSNLIAMASNLKAMASNLIATSNLRAMASSPRAMASRWPKERQ